MKKLNLRPEYVSAVTALFSLMAIGMVSYHYLEGWTWIESLYFVVVTLTTVGYGDIHPTTDASRLFTIFFILIGVSIAISSITIIGTRYLAKRDEHVAKRVANRNAKRDTK